jgi:NAD-dependent deacetylase
VTLSLAPRLAAILEAARRQPGPWVFLTGAGISAESGIPTFRGPGGYWRGQRSESLATWSAYCDDPEEIWSWYLFRRGVCRRAEPNAAHLALAALEARAPERFVLVTQNVDGLHLRAGNTIERTHQIHGNLEFMRCREECAPSGIMPIPDAVSTDWPEDRDLGENERRLLRCRHCGALARPHVLWFDESYDEPRYRAQRSMAAAEASALLMVIGTSGATSLPIYMTQAVARRSGALVVLNPDPSPFTELADAMTRGFHLEGTAVAALPGLLARLG